MKIDEPTGTPGSTTPDRDGRGCETGRVSELPPPEMPPPGSVDGSSAPPPPPPGSEKGSLLDELRDPDWDRIRSLAEDWFRPLVKSDGWVALAYLFVGVFTGIFFFLAVVGAAVITFGLSFVGVGLLLIGPVFALIGVLARAERSMAKWVGVDIPPRPTKSPGRFGWRSITDPERWRMVGYLAVNFLLGPLLFGLGSFCYTIALRTITDGWSGYGVFDVFPFNAVAGVLAIAMLVVLLGAAPRIAVWVAALKAHVTAWFLGPDKLALAEQRVTALSTQRQDILDAVASERRRIERNLHDGVQQQLVAIGLDLGMAEQQLARDPDRARELVVQAREKVQGSIGELRQLGRGLHPAILEDRGIDAALSAIVSSAPIPISVQADDDLGLDTDVAATLYFIANEAVANVLKHAGARVASVHVTRVAANVRITVHDDGRGGADPAKGTGLAGIRARVNAVDGTMSVTSPVGGPTTIVAELPCEIVRKEREDHG